MKSFEQLLVDMRPNIDSLKSMDDERIKAVEYAEKLRIKYAGTIYESNTNTNTHDDEDNTSHKVRYRVRDSCVLCIF